MVGSFISKMTKILKDTFKVVDENIQTNLVQDLSKNAQGETVFEVVPLYKQTKMELTAQEILSNNLFISFLNKRDLKLVKAIFYAEGDILIRSKRFDENNKVTLSLESLLTKEVWLISPEELVANKAVFSRINRKHFVTALMPGYFDGKN